VAGNGRRGTWWRVGAAVLVVGIGTVAAVTTGATSTSATVDCQVTTTTTAESTITCTTSTKHITTVERVDLPDAPATACDAPATDPVKVSETSKVAEGIVTTTTYIGPQTIYVGEDQKTPLDIVPGGIDYDTLTTINITVTQTYQGTAAGEACVVVAPVNFTG